MRRLADLASFAVLLALGCDPEPARPDAQPGYCRQVALEIPIGAARDLDLLFVIDDSPSMAGEQASLAAAFGELMNALQGMVGGPPDMHIGVISANLGAGGLAIAGCAGDGDGGRLQSAARIPGCTPPADSYIVDLADHSGTTQERVTNYTGDLASTFSCIATLGTSGCEIEQPLEATRMALDPATMPLVNEGFLRPDAYLAVVFVTDEDDCSASGPALFSTPLDPFLCTEAGLLCDGAAPGRAAAAYAECEPSADETYLMNPRRHVDFLRSLKADPAQVVVSSIAGNPTPFVVGTAEDGSPVLLPSCSSDTGEATPAVRLQWLVSQFPTRGMFTSMCDSRFDDALEVVTSSGSPYPPGAVCLRGELYAEDRDGDGVAGAPVAEYDVYLDLPGIQPDCIVNEARFPGTQDLVQRPAQRCRMLDDATVDPGSPRPCWWVRPDPASCAHQPTGLAFELERYADALPDTWAVVSCLARCE